MLGQYLIFNAMKYLTFMASLLLLSPLTVYADNSPPNDFMLGPKLYIGGGLGGTQQGDSCNQVFFTGSCENKDFAWKAFTGVRLNPMTGSELTYHRLGKSQLNGSGTSANDKATNQFTGTSVSGLAFLPVAPGIEGFAKAGALFWQRKTTQTQNDQTTDASANGISPLLGLGGQYRLNPNLHLRGEWEHSFNVGSDSVYETDVDEYTLGVLYSTL